MHRCARGDDGHDHGRDDGDAHDRGDRDDAHDRAHGDGHGYGDDHDREYDRERDRGYVYDRHGYARESGCAYVHGCECRCVRGP